MFSNETQMRTFLPWTLLAILGALVAGAAVLGTLQVHHATFKLAAATECNTPTKFAGYYLPERRVTQISARWTVPQIDPGVNQGEASTWVGIQVGSRAFIQIGTDERPEPSLPDYYEAFWSSTKLQFHPYQVLAVSAGDAVEAAISHTRNGWRLYFRDLTSGRSADFVISYAKDTHFDLGEWSQEDSSVACTISPFPEMSTVTFKDLRLDDRIPRVPYRDATVLEAPNGDLVPTRVRHDGFSLFPPSGIRHTYLLATTPFNIALEDFVGDVGSVNGVGASLLGSRTHLTSLVEKGFNLAAITGADAAMTAARRLRHALRADQWPPTARAFADLLAQRLTSEIAALASTVGGHTRSGSWTLTELVSPGEETMAAASQLRRAIGLPPAQTVLAPT